MGMVCGWGGKHDNSAILTTYAGADWSYFSKTYKIVHLNEMYNFVHLEKSVSFVQIPT